MPERRPHDLHWAAAGAVLLLTACATQPPAAQSPALLPLLSPAAFGGAHSSVQLVRGAFGAREAALQCALDIGAQRVTVVGVTPMGMRAFSANYDGAAVSGQASPMVPAGFEPQRMLADIELAYWPLEAWKAALKGSAWQISEPVPGTRRLLRDGRLIEEVHYSGSDPWNSRLWIANFEFGYSLSIETLPAQ